MKKKFLWLIIWLMLFISGGLALPQIDNNSLKANAESVVDNPNYTYIEVLIDGKWFMYVYDEEGHLYSVYEIDDDE